MAKKDLTQRISPRGEVYYAHIYKPEIFEGEEKGFTIQLAFNEKDTLKMRKLLIDELEKAKGKEEFKGKKWLKEPFTGEKELTITNEDGLQEDVTVFKFKTKHEFTNRQGETFKKTIPVFDSVGNKIKKELSIGNGTLAKVSFTVAPMYVSSKVNGLSLYLDAVQILDLVEYKGATDKGAEDFGFAKEEEGAGFTYAGSGDDEEEENTTPDMDVPAADGEEDEETEF